MSNPPPPTDWVKRLADLFSEAWAMTSTFDGGDDDKGCIFSREKAERVATEYTNEFGKSMVEVATPQIIKEAIRMERAQTVEMLRVAVAQNQMRNPAAARVLAGIKRELEMSWQRGQRIMRVEGG